MYEKRMIARSKQAVGRGNVAVALSEFMEGVDDVEPGTPSGPGNPGGAPINVPGRQNVSLSLTMTNEESRSVHINRVYVLSLVPEEA